MKVHDLPIEGLKLIELDNYNDPRGFFHERFNGKKFEELHLPHHFVQDNLSKSLPHVVRGLHYQIQPAQGKLVGVISGQIWDVAVDLRWNSKTFGQHYAVTLNSESPQLFWIPAGFAHGFCVIGSSEAFVSYKVDHNYQASGDRGLRWNDPQLNIQWPVQDPILSQKDLNLPLFEDYKSSAQEDLGIWWE